MDERAPNIADGAILAEAGGRQFDKGRYVCYSDYRCPPDSRSDNDQIVCFFIFTAAVALDYNYPDLLQ